MSISLIGIIWVQVYWINNGLKVKEAQFDQLVTDALNNVVIDIAESESIDFLHDQLAGVTSEFVIETDSLDVDSQKINTWINHFTESDSSAEISSTFDYEVSSDFGESKMKMKISVNGEEREIDVEDKLKKLEELFDNDSLVVLGNKKMVLTNRFSNVMVKMAKEFKSIKQPVHHLLKEIDIEPIIEASLNENGITTPFSFAILDDDKIIKEFSSKNFTSSNNTYDVSLFKHDILDKSALLSISFSGTKHYLLKTMWLMVLCSILFTLIIILTFASTVHYMYKQKKLAEIKNDFINNMTHEFKTPISTISLAIDSITHPKIIGDKIQINYYADIIRKENKRMNTQVESVLNTSLAEKDELELNKTAVSLTAFLTKIESRLKLPVQAVNAKFVIQNHAKDVTLTVDESHLQNAICNLIDNALKYSDEPAQVELKTNIEGNLIHFTIADKGIGMNSETQKKVFDKFYRVQSGNIHKVKGFGIGLSYVKAIVNAHHGKIYLSSKLNVGTKVTISLPLK